LTCDGGGGGGDDDDDDDDLSTSDTSHLNIKYSVPQTMRITTITLLYFQELIHPFSQIFRT
jgi:hypothetical protein